MTRYYPFHNASEELKFRVWSKAKVIPGNEPMVWRQDACGHPMRYSDHGNTASQYGWEVDHILPTSKGGDDRIENLQALYWENNRRKGDTYPWYCQNAA